MKEYFDEISKTLQNAKHAPRLELREEYLRSAIATLAKWCNDLEESIEGNLCDMCEQDPCVCEEDE